MRKKNNIPDPLLFSAELKEIVKRIDHKEPEVGAVIEKGDTSSNEPMPGTEKARIRKRLKGANK